MKTGELGEREQQSITLSTIWLRVVHETNVHNFPIGPA